MTFARILSDKQFADTPAIAQGELPVGFDPDQYLALNGDVAAIEGLDAKEHYLNYGAKELRTILALGTGLDHPDSRMMSESERNNWISVFEKALGRSGVDYNVADIIARHPRAGWLYGGFTLPAYLCQHRDVAGSIDDPVLAAFHYLEIGIEEGRDGRPDAWEPTYIKARYGLELDPAVTVVEVLKAVFETGASPLQAALTEEEHWQLNNLSGATLVNEFDHEFYHAIVHRQNESSIPFDRLACIDHFIEFGIGELRPLNDNFNFDAGFYARSVPALSIARLRRHGSKSDETIPDETLYRHFLSYGITAGAASNIIVLAKREFDLNVPSALIKQLPIAKQAIGLPYDSSPEVVLRRLLSGPIPAITYLQFDIPEMMQFLVSLADRFARAGDNAQAQSLYWTALQSDPTYDTAIRHLADVLQRTGQPEAEYWMRSRVSEADKSPWKYLAMAENCIEAGRMDTAADVLSKFSSNARSDAGAKSKYRELAHRLFDKSWSIAPLQVKAFGLQATQDRLRKVLAACSPAFNTAVRTNEIKSIALVGTQDLYQCKLYRVDQKAEQLRSAGFKVEIFAPNSQLNYFCARLDQFDAAIFFRVAAFPPMIEAISKASQRGLATIYEIDDIVFDTDHFPPAFETYAGQISEDQYNSMACGVPLFEHAMKLCDYGIASTSTIATLMKDKVRTGRVFEHHNALGRLHLLAERSAAQIMKPNDAPLVIFYGSGTRAHKEDFHEILEPALAEMVKRFPEKIEIRLIGHFGDFKYLDMEADPVTVMEPVWDFEEFMSHVANADINLSVLAPSLLTDAKSEIKWMEAGLFKTPSVVSDTTSHRDVIEHGVTGFLANNTSDFITFIDALIRDDELRTRVGLAAHNTVVSTYGLADMGENLCSIFQDIRPPVTPKKRIVIVNVFYPPQAIGGATRVVHDNVTQLHKMYGDEFEIDVICTLEGGAQPLEVNSYAQDGIRVWTITAPHNVEGDMAAHNNSVYDVFEKLVAHLDPELIHFHCIQRLTAAVTDVARHRNIPYVITLHDGWWISPNQFILGDDGQPEYYDYNAEKSHMLPSRAQALRRSLLGARQLLAVSESFGLLHEACGLKNVSVIENGVSNLPEPVHTRSSSGRVRLAHIGGASRHKGIHHVRNALSAYNFANLELLLIDHALSPETVRYEIWGNTPVTIQGKVGQSEIASLYGRIDILLAPSIWPESYGLVTREATAMETWVIAGDQGAIGADIIEGVNGHVVETATYQGLMDALIQVDNNHELYLTAPKKTGQQRTSQNQAEDLAVSYRKILKEKSI